MEFNPVLHKRLTYGIARTPFRTSHAAASGTQRRPAALTCSRSKRDSPALRARGGRRPPRRDGCPRARRRPAPQAEHGRAPALRTAGPAQRRRAARGARREGPAATGVLPHSAQRAGRSPPHLPFALGRTRRRPGPPRRAGREGSGTRARLRGEEGGFGSRCSPKGEREGRGERRGAALPQRPRRKSRAATGRPAPP